MDPFGSAPPMAGIGDSPFLNHSLSGVSPFMPYGIMRSHTEIEYSLYAISLCHLVMLSIRLALPECARDSHCGERPQRSQGKGVNPLVVRAGRPPCSSLSPSSGLLSAGHRQKTEIHPNTAPRHTVASPLRDHPL